MRTLANVMGLDCFAVRFGAPAAATLAAVIGAHRGDDPLAPLVVLVPDNLTGVMARRVLGTHGGFVNISFVTPAGLAGRVAGGSPASVSNVVLSAVVRDVLATETRGLFAPVAAHPATELALVGATRTLAGAAPTTLDELARSPSPRTRAVVALHRSVQGRLTNLTDEHQLAWRGASAVRADPSVASTLGSIVVYLVDELAPASLALLLALSEVLPVTVIIGVAGSPSADQPLAWWSGAVGGVDVPSPEPRGVATAATSAEITVFTATDSDDEVRHALRGIVERAEAGVPLARMALLYATAEPYQRLVHEQLEAAGIVHNGPAVRALSGALAGRAARALLALVDGRWSREEVLDLAAGVPGLGADGHARPVGSWDAISRSAGVVGGLDDWHQKLARYGASREGRDRAVSVASLQAFLRELTERAVAVRSLTTWPDLARWLRGSLGWLVGDPTTWPADESAALDSVHGVIDELAGLAAFDRRPGLAGLARALDTALEVPAGRVGRLGIGVQVGPLEHARALDADIVFVVGLAEGLCPAPPTEDTLLPDAERRLALHGELALATSRVGAQQRSLLAALAAAREECVLGFPRGDHRGGRTRLPSRWLLDALGHDGARPTTDDFLVGRCAGVEHIASFGAGLRDAVTAVHGTERRLRVLEAAGPGALATHPLRTPGLARGVMAITARRSSAFTAWDGNLADRAVPSPSGGVVMSATRLETWAACPFRYFLGSVLGLGRRDTPEQLDQVSALERGSLLHTVLERFIGESLASPPAPHEPWSAAQGDRLHAIASEVFADAEARGATGPAIRWRREQVDLRAVLDQFLVDDSAQRAARSSTPLAVELAFGIGDAAPLEVRLPGGRVLSFRGFIDRIDRTEAGDAVVLDYKSGKHDRYAGLADDPVAAGTKLQLPLYALAAAQATGASVGSAHYWFIESGRSIGYHLDPDRLARFHDVLGAITDGISAGMFLAHPGEYNSFYGTHSGCQYCDFDRVCDGSRGEQWSAKTADLDPADPRSRYLALTETSE